MSHSTPRATPMLTHDLDLRTAAGRLGHGGTSTPARLYLRAPTAKPPGFLAASVLGAFVTRSLARSRMIQPPQLLKRSY